MPHEQNAIKLRHIKWAFAAALVAYWGILEAARILLYPYLTHWPGRLVMDAFVLVSILSFFAAAFTLVSRMQHKLAQQNKELLALHRAALDIHGELGLEKLLQKIVDQARFLLDARYGAISVIDSEGHIQEFITAGISDEARASIGNPPQGDGLLGVPLHDGELIRVRDISRDSRSVGFPSRHPLMHTLLGVPIVCRGDMRGNLYVTDKEDGLEFTGDDEESLVRFATSAAIAIDSAVLHQRLRSLAVAEERVRIAREMHDGMAQVLAYVNTKAQAVAALLEKGRTLEARGQLKQLAEAAREVYTDVREGIAALRTQVGADQTFDQALTRFIESWQDQSGIHCQVEIEPDLRLPVTTELQLLRIVQEALANIRKHAAARQAAVRIAWNDGRLEVRIRDDGRGFDPREPRSGEFPRFGLAIMRERAEAIHADFNVETAPGEGTRVAIDVPIPRNTAMGEPV